MVFVLNSFSRLVFVVVIPVCTPTNRSQSSLPLHLCQHLFFLSFQLSAILTGMMRWYLIVVRFAFLKNKIWWTFIHMPFGNLYGFSEKISLQISCLFLIRLLHFLLLSYMSILYNWNINSLSKVQITNIVSFSRLPFDSYHHIVHCKAIICMYISVGCNPICLFSFYIGVLSLMRFDITAKANVSRRIA